MNKPSSKLFNCAGYIPLKEYVADIESLRDCNQWHLPLNFSDKVRFLFLSLFARFFWFSDSLFVKYPNMWSPSYNIIISYLKKNGQLLHIKKKDLRHNGYVSYMFKKNMRIGDHVLSISGQGVSRDAATAFSKALGETVERIISGIGDTKEKIVASKNELALMNDVVYPPLHHRHLPIQKEKYSLLNNDADDKIEWVEGINLITNKKTYIPSHITSWFHGGSLAKKNLQHTTSNGCAGYFTKEGAAVRGLLEAVHRDGFFVHWLTTIAPTVFDPETLPQEARELIQEFNSHGITIYVLNITSLTIPSVYIAAISHESDLPQIILSGASALNFKDAILDALEEMVMLSSAFYRDCTIPLNPSLDAEPAFISKINQSQRQLYWRGKEKIKQFEWFVTGKKISYEDASREDISHTTDDAQKLKLCLDTLEKMEPSYYPVAYYPRNQIQTDLGFYIAQIYIPMAFPLYLSEYFGTFDSDRLTAFALSKKVPDWKLNQLPHMFS